MSVATATVEVLKPVRPFHAHLGRLVPHVGNVLLLAVVLRPGTCQVSASERALRGPQLDATAGGEEENEEQCSHRGAAAEENRGEMRRVKAAGGI